MNIKALVPQWLKKVLWIPLVEAGGMKVLVYKYLFWLFKVHPHKIVMVNEVYDCNPKAILEEILRRGLNYEIVWLSDYDKSVFPEYVKVCHKTGWRGAYHLATSKIIILNSKGDVIRFIKKKAQFQIQTLHGRCPFKLVEGEAIDKLPPLYLKRSMQDSLMTDLMLSDSKWTTDLYRKAFWFQGEIMEKGFPVNDIYYNATQEFKDKLREKLGIEKGWKVITYAPTFRDNGNMDCYGLDAPRLLKALKDKTGDRWTLLVRAHPNLQGKALPFDFSDDVRDVSMYPDVQHIFLVTDLLITDYSSVQMDNLLMNNPIILFVTDEEEYIAQRGIRHEYYEMPYPHCHNNDEVIESVRALDFAHPFSPYVNEFLKLYGSAEDGHASKCVVDRILEEAPLN